MYNGNNFQDAVKLYTTILSLFFCTPFLCVKFGFDNFIVDNTHLLRTMTMETEFKNTKEIQTHHQKLKEIISTEKFSTLCTSSQLSYSHKNKVQCWRLGMHLSFPPQWRCKLEAETDGGWQSWIPYYNKISKQMAGRQLNKLIIDMKILTAWLIYLSSNFAWVPWWSSSVVVAAWSIYQPHMSSMMVKVCCGNAGSWQICNKSQKTNWEVGDTFCNYCLLGRQVLWQWSFSSSSQNVCMCSSWLPAQQKLKIIWHYAFCCWLHPWSAMCPPFSNFHKTLAVSSKDMQSVPKGPKKKPIWKENCCCRASKRKPNKKTEQRVHSFSCYIIYNIFLFMFFGNLTCWSLSVDARNLWQICTLEIGSCRHV